jgi:hypothetical protein
MIKQDEADTKYNVSREIPPRDESDIMKKEIALPVR